MTSYRRHSANLRNARRSTGPRTPKGKAAVRLNSLWHGAFAKDLLLPGEDRGSFSKHRDSYLASYKPASDAEEFLVNRMILASWRLFRLAAMEPRVLRAHASQRSSDFGISSLLIRPTLRSILDTQSLADLQAAYEKLPNDSEPLDEIALAWIRDSTSGNLLVKLVRHQNSLERSFYRALHELERLRGGSNP